MLPYGTEVCSVPRFAVDQEAATAHPGLVCLHDEVVCGPSLSKISHLTEHKLYSVSLSQLQAARQVIDFQYRFGGTASVPNIQYLIMIFNIVPIYQ